MNSKKPSALVVFSGGQDSTTCLYWARERFERVVALSFTYGQKHIDEVRLTDTSLAIEAEKPADAPPSTFVPGRNMFFLSIAAVFARERGIHDLVTGVGQTDFSGYPDCRDAFIKSLNVTLNLAMDDEFRIHTPLMWLDKAETWALADELGIYPIIRYRTLTCYNGIVGDGCGQCPACQLRHRGLEKYLAAKGMKDAKKQMQS